MLRIAISKVGYLSTITRDGTMLPVKEAHIHMSPSETIIHLILHEYDGVEIKERDEVIRMTEEDVQLEFVK